jgi:hypothetical protein
MTPLFRSIPVTVSIQWYCLQGRVGLQRQGRSWLTNRGIYIKHLKGGDPMAMRTVNYIGCRRCNRNVEVYFAHGAIQVYSCSHCYRKLGRFEKLWRKLMKKIWSK